MTSLPDLAANVANHSSPLLSKVLHVAESQILRAMAILFSKTAGL